MGKIDGVYLVLNWMTGESVYTHQLPRICREAAPVIVALHPELSLAIDEAKQVTRDNYQLWVTKWTERYGDEITVPMFAPDEHKVIDPISELAEHVDPDKIILVGT